MLKCGSSGRKIGMKMMMISVHSSGQPRMKMMNCARIMNCTGVMLSDRTHFSMTSCPPSSANAAEKMPEPTNSQHTIALVLAVRKDDSLTMAPSSFTVLQTTLPVSLPLDFPSRQYSMKRGEIQRQGYRQGGLEHGIPAAGFPLAPILNEAVD